MIVEFAAAMKWMATSEVKYARNIKKYISIF